MDVRRGLTAAGVVVIALGGPPLTAARQDERPRVSLHIKNYAEVSRDDLGRARTEVERIFDTADVEVAWVGADAPGSISILLLSITRDSQQDNAGCALGLALASKSMAYVFVNRIVRATRNRAADLPVVLGRVIAHESGHILMPQMRHSHFGIMRADLDFGYANPSGFSGEQALTIRSRLRAGANQ